MECAATSIDPFRCPTKWELWRQIIDLLPRGRAWQTHEEIAEIIVGPGSQVGTFETDETPLGSEFETPVLTVMQRFWAALATVGEFSHQRACRLLEEFYCATTVEQLRQWQIDYGFPDPCDPWHSLCDKVRAQGGATCAYLAEIAADRGWSLTCSECEPNGDGVARAGCAAAGCGKTCGCPGNVIWVTITLNDSISYVRPVSRAARAGDAAAGAQVGSDCPPGAEPLQCLIERWKPAHVKAIYIYV